MKALIIAVAVTLQLHGRVIKVCDTFNRHCYVVTERGDCISVTSAELECGDIVVLSFDGHDFPTAEKCDDFDWYGTVGYKPLFPECVAVSEAVAERFRQLSE